MIKYLTKHACDRLYERGITPEIIENTVAHGKKRLSRETGRTVYLKGPYVVVTVDDVLITAWKNRPGQKILVSDILAGKTPKE